MTSLNDLSGESFRTYKENGKVGYKDFLGNVVIQPKFAGASEFSQGVAQVQFAEANRRAYINVKGELITELKYNSAGSSKKAYDGLIRVAVGENSGQGSLKYGFINTKGQEIVKPQFDMALSFSDGRAAVYKFQRTIDGMDYYKVGWINTEGRLVIPYSSDEYVWYANSVHNFHDGLVPYSVKAAQGMGYLPSVGVMDKNGKIIIPANMDDYMGTGSHWGLDWKDGIILYAPFRSCNIQGKLDPKGKYYWPHLYIYDYSGNLIAKPEGYVQSIVLGGGYILAMYQVPTGAAVGGGVGGEKYEAYWSIMDANGKIVKEKLEPNNFDLINHPMGYENGYVFFGNHRYKLPRLTVGKTQSERHPFTDVKSGSYYEDAVVWALKNNVTGGTTAETFSPDSPCTRGEVVTFLYRASGQPKPTEGKNPFTDIHTNDYYYKAVLWAVEKGITSGTTAETFSPDSPCTKGQVVTFLYRANGTPPSFGFDSPYYAKAVSWAAQKGLLDNMGAFSENDISPRSDIVTYLYRNEGSPK